MHRIFLILALGAACFGVWVLFTSPDPATIEGVMAATEPGWKHTEWAVGLLMGMVMAWLASVNWRGFPERLGGWIKLQRRRLALLIIGGACAGVLLLF